MSTAHTDSDWIVKERRWFSNGQESLRPFRRLHLIHLYNQFMDGVDLQDQLRWYYRFCGKRMWRNLKWTWSIFMWVLNTAIVQAYISHVILFRDAVSQWEIHWNTWKQSQRRLRSGRGTPESVLKRCFSRLHGDKPKALTHMEFRIHLSKYWAHHPTTTTTTQDVPDNTSTRRVGRPRTTDIPMRKVGKKSKPTSLAGGVAKRRAGRVDSTRRLTKSGGMYDLRTIKR